jgi:hypothetical protein
MRYTKKILVLFALLYLSYIHIHAQCSVCTKGAQQLGERPARGMNTGILILAFTPFVVGGIVYYYYKKQNLNN